MHGLTPHSRVAVAPTATSSPTVPSVRGAALELAFLATGDYQQVFTRADADDGWVYKVPAAFGYYLPFRCFWPRNPLEWTMRLMLRDVPEAGLRRTERAGAVLAGRLPAGAAVVGGVARIARATRVAGERVLASYGRRIRRRHFATMLALLDDIGHHGPADVLLPWRVLRHARARLSVAGKIHAYHGPLLAQRRARVFESGQSLAAFDWGELVAAQHRLWRHGLAFCGLREVLGPKSWGLLDGRLHLADTSALTRRYRVARDYLGKDRLDRREQRVRQQLAATGEDDLADAYFRVIRAEINQRRLAELWRVDVPPRGAGEGR